MLVTDGEQRAALAAVRSLGRAGYRVHVCSSRAASIAGASRYCAASYRVADPLTDSNGFLSDLERLVITSRADVLIPISEAALLAILPARLRLQCVIPFPTAAAFDRICDKRQALAVAKAHGVAVPEQIEVATPADAARVKGELRFPLVLKPSRSVAGTGGKRIRVGVSYADTQEELEKAIADVPPDAFPVLLQERIAGPGFGTSVLLWDGKLIAAFSHRRIREKPPSGGVSVLSESIPLDQTLLDKAVAVLKEFKWQGVAMVEFKLAAATGIPYLMEINGRLWGSLQLAIDAGVDFPRLLVEAALGVNPAPVLSYRSGGRLRWEWGDFDHLLASREKLTTIQGFIGGRTSENKLEVFRADDPAPFVRETIDWLLRR